MFDAGFGLADVSGVYFTPVAGEVARKIVKKRFARSL
jgi:hypothetical protein